MKVLIPCAGLGTRLMPLTKDTPKCMLEVGGKPIVEHIVNQLVEHGFKDIWISLRHKIDGLLCSSTARINYLFEPVPKGTAGTVRDMYASGIRGPLLVHYGDVLSDLELRRLACVDPGWATAVVHQREWNRFSGIALLSNECMRSIRDFGVDGPLDLSRDHFARNWDKIDAMMMIHSYRFCIDSLERLSEARSFFEHEYHRLPR